MKSKSFKRVTAAVLGLSMVGTGMLANMGGIGLFEDFSLTADAAETQTVTLHFYESTTSKLKDVEVPLDTEYTFKSPGDLFSTQILRSTDSSTGSYPVRIKRIKRTIR